MFNGSEFTTPSEPVLDFYIIDLPENLEHQEFLFEKAELYRKRIPNLRKKLAKLKFQSEPEINSKPRPKSKTSEHEEIMKEISRLGCGIALIEKLRDDKKVNIHSFAEDLENQHTIFDQAIYYEECKIIKFLSVDKDALVFAVTNEIASLASQS